MTNEPGTQIEFTIAGPVPVYVAPAPPEQATSHDGPESTSAPTVIIEDGFIPRRVRRPLDLARFILAVAVAAGTVFLGWFFTSTTAGLDSDIESGAALLPSFVVLVLNIVGGIGTLGLPIAMAVSLLIRKRGRQLFDALVALLLTIVLLTIISIAVTSLENPRLLVALAGSVVGTSAATTPMLGGLVAFVTVTRLMGRRPWNALSIVIIGSLVVVTVLSAGIALAGVGLSLAIGWAIGLLTRYVAGTPTTRPTGVAIVSALETGGFPITMLRAVESTDRGRRYRATTRNDSTLDVTVLDRDLEGAGLAQAFWTALRLRDDSGSGAFNMRRAVDQASLVAYAGQVAGAPQPRLLIASEIGPDACLLGYQRIDAQPLADSDGVTDAELESAWRGLRTLHEHQISHRQLTPRTFIRASDGGVWIKQSDNGSVAASDLAIRIDIAEMLCSLAILTDADRAIATGRNVLGAITLSRALPALQPVALSRTLRKEVRAHKGLLVNLRDGLVELRPDDDVVQIQLERIRPRTLIMIVVGTIAGYVLLSQLASVDLPTLLSTANWWWMLAAVGLSLITYLGAAWSLSGFVPERIPLHRTMLAQVAGDFATLVSPPTIGAIAINVRFLQKAGLHPALAGASVGVAQVMAFVMHIILLFAFGIAAGTQADFTFDPPMFAVIAVAAVAVIALALLAVPAVRAQISKRVIPLIREVIPRLVTVAQRPAKLAEGIGGIVLLNFAYIGVLFASIEAFGGSMNIAVVAVVYLAGATIGQAAPTPGGLGAVEAALVAGLTAGGLDAGLAVSAVLLYRLVTFWIPTIPGYWAFNYLTKKGAL